MLLLMGCSDDSSSSPESLSGETAVSSSSEILEESSSSEILKESSSSEILDESSSSQEVVTGSSSQSSSSAELSALAELESNPFFDEGWREKCLDIINNYRATESLAPLALAPEEKQLCTYNQAADDLAENTPHGHFHVCGEWAQNSGPNGSVNASTKASDLVNMYLKMMWEDEKALVTSGKKDPAKDEDYPAIGHYLNMKGNYKSVACSIALSADGSKGWLNVNFF